MCIIDIHVYTFSFLIIKLLRLKVLKLYTWNSIHKAPLQHKRDADRDHWMETQINWTPFYNRKSGLETRNRKFFEINRRLIFFFLLVCTIGKYFLTAVRDLGIKGVCAREEDLASVNANFFLDQEISFVG